MASKVLKILVDVLFFLQTSKIIHEACKRLAYWPAVLSTYIVIMRCFTNVKQLLPVFIRETNLLWIILQELSVTHTPWKRWFSPLVYEKTNGKNTELWDCYSK